MKKSTRFSLLNKTKLIACCCVLFAVTHTYAQPIFGDHVLVAPTEGLKSNDWLQFYYDTYDTTRPMFKSVTETRYNTQDTTKYPKKVDSKVLTTFNEVGEKLLYKSADSAGTIDSIIDVYNAKHYKTHEAEFVRSDSGKGLRKQTDQTWWYDAKENVIKDSSYTYKYVNEEYDEGDGQGTSGITVELNDYDAAGNLIENRVINNKDTTFQYSKYDSKNREIFSRSHSLYADERVYTTYDANGNEIIKTTASYGDSEIVNNTYSGLHTFTGFTKINKGKIIETTTVTYGADSAITDVDDKTPISEDNSCPNNSRTVTVYDKYGNQLSEITTKEKGSKPFTIKTIHKYVFDNYRILSDSTFHTEQGYLYSLTSVVISTYKYDKHGNRTEQANDGGGEYALDERETWTYNEQNNIVKYSKYNSCNDLVPERETTYVYYKDGIKVKALISNTTDSGGKRDVTYYDENERKTENVVTEGPSKARTVFEYKK